MVFCKRYLTQNSWKYHIIRWRRTIWEIVYKLEVNHDAKHCQYFFVHYLHQQECNNNKYYVYGDSENDHSKLGKISDWQVIETFRKIPFQNGNLNAFHFLFLPDFLGHVLDEPEFLFSRSQTRVNPIITEIRNKGQVIMTPLSYHALKPIWTHMC